MLIVAWPEDRATLGSDPSAEPGTKHRTRGCHHGIPFSVVESSGIGTNAINPSSIFVVSLDCVESSCTTVARDVLPVESTDSLLSEKSS